MIASTPPTFPAEAVVFSGLSNKEKTHFDRANILGGERGTFLVKAESKNSIRKTPFLITIYKLIGCHTLAMWSSSNPSITYLSEGNMVTLDIFDHPRMNLHEYFRFGVIVVTDRVDSKSRRRRRSREELCKNSR